jgi:hypothetical protein
MVPRHRALEPAEGATTKRISPHRSKTAIATSGVGGRIEDARAANRTARFRLGSIPTRRIARAMVPAMRRHSTKDDRYRCAQPHLTGGADKPVGFLQRSANILARSHCRAGFLFPCHEFTTRRGRGHEHRYLDIDSDPDVRGRIRSEPVGYGATLLATHKFSIQPDARVSASTRSTMAGARPT